MTQSFILMALGIGIGYSITLWLQRHRGTSVPAIGPITDMHSVAHGSISSAGGKVGMSVTAGGVDKLVRESGAEVVLLVGGNGELIVADAETGARLPDFVDSEHAEHPAEIRLNEQGEPVLHDKETGQPIVVYEKTCDKPFRVPVPKSDRHLDARVIYFWRYKGSRCLCTWSGGDHYVWHRR